MNKWMMMLCVGMGLRAGVAQAVKPGEAAPDFKAPSTAGRELSRADFAGKWLVLYFYPKSFTPGCTTQTCSLRDGYAGIQALGAVILGVSVDKLETQEKFKAEHKLPFDLLADAKGEVARAYGALGLGGFTARRVTFVVDPEGRIAAVIEQVKTGSHDAQVAAVLRELQGREASPE